MSKTDRTRLIFKEYYSDGEDLFFRPDHLKSDLQRIGYDEEHIEVIIKALREKADIVE